MGLPAYMHKGGGYWRPGEGPDGQGLLACQCAAGWRFYVGDSRWKSGRRGVAP